MRSLSPNRIRWFVGASWACLIGAYWLLTATGTTSVAVTHWLYLVLLAAPSLFVVVRALARRDNRVLWAVLGVGLTLWTAGSVWQVLLDLRGDTASVPDIGDALWLSLYPCAFVAVGLLARARLGRPPASLVLDSVMVMLVLSAAINALVLPPVLANANGLSGLAQAVLIAYPLADSVLVAVAITSAVFVGWREGPVVTLIGVGAAALAATDALWALSASGGAWEPVMASNALYPLWPTLVAAAAWCGVRDATRVSVRGGELRVMATALVAVLAAIGLLVANEWVAVTSTAVVLAALALLAAINRFALGVAESVQTGRARGRRAGIVDDVRRAMGAGQLLLHFQPLTDAQDGTVRGAEALLRWERDGTMVPPGDFLPIVEQTALMGSLTDFVIDEALRTLAGWRRDGHDIGVSVNLAARNLSDRTLPSSVEAALARHLVPPGALTLEVTETAVIEDGEAAAIVLEDLHRLGVELSIDDFGTGHSSLVRLAQFPIDELKIDRSFVQQLGTTDRPIVATAVQLAHALGLRVVAEGVETIGALNALRAMGCEIAQGYFISRPLAAQDFIAWVDARAGRVDAPSDVHALLDGLVTQLGMDAAFIAEFVGDRKVVRAFEGPESFGPLRERAEMPRSESYCDRVARGVFPNIIRAAQEDDRTQTLAITRDADLGAYLGVPLYRDSGELYGTLCCVSHGPRPGLAEGDVETARRAAQQLGPWLAQADLTLVRGDAG